MMFEPRVSQEMSHRRRPTGSLNLEAGSVTAQIAVALHDFTTACGMSWKTNSKLWREVPSGPT